MSPWPSRRRDRELKAEIEAHLRLATTDRIDRGASPEEAAAAARRELGNISQIQEATRDAWGGRWIENLGQDVRYALRTFRRNRGFAAVAILSLALGIGANTALFGVVNAVRLRALPVVDPSELVEVRITDMDGARGNFQSPYATVTQPIWRQIESRQEAFSGVLGWARQSFNLATGGETHPADGLWVTGDFFSVLGVRPGAGRLLARDDARPGCAPRVVLGHAFWRQAFGGSPSAIGRTLTLDGRAAEIVGVAPAGFFGLEVGRGFDIALPLCAEPAFSEDGKGRADAGTSWWLSVFGRLKPGWSVDRANAHLAAISREVFRASLPATYPPASVEKYLNFRLGAHPAASGLSTLRESYEMPLWLLLGIAGFVLVIACANLANLLLARATAREREIAVRLGLGASRGRVIRQLLTESLLLAAIGALCAVLLAGTLGRSLVAFLETSDTTITLSLGPDWRVIGFAAALALTTCVLFGLAPALRGTRVAAGALLRSTARGTTAGREAAGLRRGLVIAQVAVSVVLLFGSLLFARSLKNVLAIDPGFRSDGVIVADVDMRPLHVPVERRQGFRRDVIDRIRALPGIEGADSVAVVPISGDATGNDVWAAQDRTHRFSTLLNSVGSTYFQTIGTRLLAGRAFDERDTPASVPVAIVNEAFATAMAAGAPVIGAHFTREATPSSPEKTFEIVGVVRDSKYLELKEHTGPVAFLADTQGRPGPYLQIMMRSSLPPAAATADLTRALNDVDPRIAVSYSVLSTRMRDTLVRERLLAVLSGAFGLLAVSLTVVGLYGLVAYTTTRRTNEIGVRMALGATRGDIARLILRETGVLLGIGTAAGVALAVAAARITATLLFQVGPSDPMALFAAVATLGVMAIVASYAPARRAARIEPVSALRVE